MILMNLVIPTTCRSAHSELTRRAAEPGTKGRFDVIIGNALLRVVLLWPQLLRQCPAFFLRGGGWREGGRLPGGGVSLGQTMMMEDPTHPSPSSSHDSLLVLHVLPVACTGRLLTVSLCSSRRLKLR